MRALRRGFSQGRTAVYLQCWLIAESAKWVLYVVQKDVDIFLIKGPHLSLPFTNRCAPLVLTVGLSRTPRCR